MEERGVALVLALMTVLLLWPLGLALVATTSTELLIEANYRNSQQGLYAADAAAERALAELPAVAAWNTPVRWIHAVHLRRRSAERRPHARGRLDDRPGAGRQHGELRKDDDVYGGGSHGERHRRSAVGRQQPRLAAVCAPSAHRPAAGWHRSTRRSTGGCWWARTRQRPTAIRCTMRWTPHGILGRACWRCVPRHSVRARRAQVSSS